MRVHRAWDRVVGVRWWLDPFAFVFFGKQREGGEREGGGRELGRKRVMEGGRERGEGGINGEGVRE